MDPTAAVLALLFPPLLPESPGPVDTLRQTLRPLIADRPDITEAAVTVDAGHFQVEASLVDWSRAGSDDTLTAVAALVKWGLTASTDVQLGFDSYTSAEDGGADLDGFGDIQVRVKHNLWGNDSGDDALAVMPYLKIPTGTDLSNGRWEGGLIVPYARDLGAGFGLGLMAQVDLVHDDAGASRYDLLHSSALSYAVTDALGVFGELVGTYAEDQYRTLAACGVTYLVHADLMVDAGLRLPLDEDREDPGMFVGFTARH